MFDARIFTAELDTAHKILNEKQAIFRGEYAIHDAIYASKDPNQKLDSVFLRLRYISKNIWSEKPYIIALKQTKIKEIGKQSIIPVKKQFDTEKEAREFITENYSAMFEFSYEFNRIGWQYDLGEDQIDLEDIEGHYSIEFKSPTEQGLKDLLALFNAKNIIVGPSVVTIKNLLDR